MVELEWCVGFFVIGIILGIWFGQFVVNIRWSENAYGPQRFLYNKRFYKVYEIDHSVSFDYLNEHIPHETK